MVDRATLRVLEIAVGSAHVDTSKLGPGVPISLGSHWFDYALVALVVLLFGAFVLARRRFGFGGGGPRVAPSILILVAAGVVAAVAWPTLRTWGFCGDEVHGGANIDHAVVLALLCAVLGSVALRALRPDSRYVAAGLLVAAVLLSVCLALVAVDSAAYAVHNSGGGGGDMFNCPYDAETSIHRVWYLYPAWGSAVALLLLQAVRAFRYVRRPTDSGTESGEADGE
jgi:hypothetical protein